MTKNIKYNLHTHSKFCDGSGNIEDFIKTSINNNIDVLGFSSHAPLPFDNSFSIKEEKITQYIDEIQLLKNNYSHKIEILTGLECDYIHGLSQSFSFFKQKYNLDYIIGGVHLVGKNIAKNLWFIDGPKREIYDNGLKKFYNNNAQKAVTEYYTQMLEMLQEEEMDILAHLDKIKMHNQDRFFSTHEKWYNGLVMEVLELVKQKDIIAEINYRGIYKKRYNDFYPSLNILKKMKEMNIRICISSDAHHHSELDVLHQDALHFAQSAGYKETWCLERSIPIL